MPQHIYPNLFRDILNYFYRCELEKLQYSCNQVNRLVDNIFPDQPYRVWDDLIITTDKKNQIAIYLRNKNKVWNPESRTWLLNYKWQTAMRNGHYSLEQMIPYIGKKAKVKATHIALRRSKFLREVRF